MKNAIVILILLSLNSTSLFASSRQSKNDRSSIKETYAHSYGIIVSKKDWIKRGRDGTVTKALKDGTVITEHFVKGLSNGDKTFTFPHSSVLAKIESYDMNILLSRKTNFQNGLMAREEIFLEDGSVTVISMQQNTDYPISTETTMYNKVIAGEYRSPTANTTSYIVNGNGIRSVFSIDGTLQTEEVFKDGKIISKTSFYPNEDPHTIVCLSDGMLDGKRSTYLIGGIPSSIEEWSLNKQHGLTILFKNGMKVSEIPYINGMKNGIEIKFSESSEIVEEISWKNNMLHGARKIHSQGVLKTEWFHFGKSVSRSKFDRLNIA